MASARFQIEWVKQLSKGVHPELIFFFLGLKNKSSQSNYIWSGLSINYWWKEEEKEEGMSGNQ